MKKFFKTLVATMLVAIMATAFTSCGIPSDSAKAKANLEKNGYTVSESVATAAVKLVFLSQYSKIETALWAINSDGENVLIVYCTDSDTAKTVNENIKSVYDKVKEGAAENGENADLKSGKAGKAVYIGTKAGVKAAG